MAIEKCDTGTEVSDEVVISADGKSEQLTKKVKLRHKVSIWAAARQSAIGVLLSIFCALAYSTNSFLMKYLMMQGVISPYFAAFSRQCAIVSIVVPMTRFFRVQLFNSPALNNNWKPIVVRCSFGSAALVYYLGLYFAPLADIGVIFTSTLPIFSGILGRIFLGERIRYTDIIFMVTAATGVALILRPPYLFPPEYVQNGEDETAMVHRLIGGGCALLASSCMAAAILGTRSCVGEVHYTAIVFWNSLTGLFVSLTVMVALNGFLSPCNGVHRLLVVIAGVSGLLGQASATLAVRYISPVIVSLSSSVELAFLFFYQTTVLGNIPHLFSIIGSSVILSSMALLVVRAWVVDKMKQQENHTASQSEKESKENG